MRLIRTIMYAIAYEIGSQWLLDKVFKMDSRPLIGQSLEDMLHSIGRTCEDTYITDVKHCFWSKHMYKNGFTCNVVDRDTKKTIVVCALFGKDFPLVHENG